MIFCLYGVFLENSLSKQNVPSPHMLAVCMQGEGESLSFFFLRLAALCMVLLGRFKIFLGLWIGGIGVGFGIDSNKNQVLILISSWF